MDWSTTTNYDAGVQASMPIIYLLEFCHNSLSYDNQDHGNEGDK